VREKNNKLEMRAQRKRGESEIPFVYRLIKFGKSPSWSSTNQRLHKERLMGWNWHE
jgi:hypothetical protein